MKTNYYSCAWMITFFTTVAISQETNAQSACPNTNFSDLNFSSWVGNTGNYNNPALNGGIVPGRHTIFSAPAIDPNTCGGLNVIPPGETTSARLGNAGTGAQAEQLLYSMVVNTQNALFIYKYAVVLENPAGHAPNEQPEFSVRILDNLGNPIGGNCGTYTVYGGQPGQNFQNCGGVTWLPWTTVGIDLTAFTGQQVFIEFTTKDCSLSGHFGYAYISAGCSPLSLNMNYCAGDQQITLQAPNGFQQYTWMPGNLNGQNITIPTPAIGTIYTCTMTTFSNQGNCSVDVNVTIAPTIVTASFPLDSICAMAAMQFFDSSTVSTGVISAWNWDFGDGNQSNIANPQHAYALGGNYQVTLITTSDVGCMDTIQQNITIHALPTVAFLIDGVCSNDSVAFFNQSNGAAPLSYTWNFGDGTSSTLQSPSHMYAQGGNYPVVLSVQNGFGCVDSLQQLTPVNAPPLVNAGPDQQVCPLTNVTLTASGAVNYSWNNGVVNNNPFVVSSASTYIVIGTAANGCMNQDTVNVTLFQPPVVSAGIDQTTCFGQTIVLNGAGAVNYSWNNGVTNNTGFVAPLGLTSYTLIGTDVNGCSDTDVVTVNVNPLPVVNYSFNGHCSNEPIIFTDLSSGALPLTYTWDFGDGTSSNASSPTHLFANAGNQTVVLTVENGFGCIDSVTQIIPLQAPPLVNAGANQTVCQFATITLTASGAVNYVWNNNVQNNVPFEINSPSDYIVTGTDANGCVSSDTVFVGLFPSFTVSAGVDQEACFGQTTTLVGAGAVTYNWDNGVIDNQAFNSPLGQTLYTLIGTDVNGCSDTDEVMVNIHPLPIVNAGIDQIICLGATTSLNATGASTYQWNNGVVNGVAFTPNNNAMYTVIGTSNFGCSNSDSVQITFETNPGFNVSFSTTNGCMPLPVTLTSNTQGIGSFNWNFGDGSSGFGNSILHEYNVDGCFDVSLEMISNLGCSYDTSFIQAICVYPLPTAAFQPNPYYMSEVNPTTSMQNSSLGAVSYAWDFGDATFSQNEEPTHTYAEEPGEYTIILSVVSDHGCVDTAQATVVVEEDLIYYVPNSFTPDGDQHNGIFKPVIESGFDPNSYRFYIFNRWGQLIFESKDIEEGWNGTFDGVVAQDGTYTWKIEFKSTLRRQVENVVTGHVNLLR